VPDVLNFFRYVSLFGNVFSPVAGVLVFDYLFVRRMQIDVIALYDRKGRYRYWAGFNPIAVAWTAIGFLICTYVIPTAWIPALLTLLDHAPPVRGVEPGVRPQDNVFGVWPKTANL
jgi:cytosine/uracil/thiamine/allantoin permease